MDPRLPMAEVGSYAARVERLGFDALHVPETVHDSLVVAALALEHTETLIVRTGVTVAFVRSPMQLALTAWSLAAMAPGRFDLGLGSQIRANIEDRHGMAWSDPVERMADVLTAIRACFGSFATGEALDHRGPVHQLSRLQPEFRPAPLDGPAPGLWLGAVNAGMCAVAGRLADGVMAHPTNSAPDHLRDVMGPAILAGSAAAGRPVPPVIVAPPVVTGVDDAALAAALDARLPRLAFVLSTPAYAATLRRLGHGELAGALRSAIRGGSDDLGALLPRAVIEELCVIATHDGLAAAVADRYGQACSGLLLRPTEPDEGSHGDAAFAEVVAALRAVTAG